MAASTSITGSALTPLRPLSVVQVTMHSRYAVYFVVAVHLLIVNSPDVSRVLLHLIIPAAPALAVALIAVFLASLLTIFKSQLSSTAVSTSTMVCPMDLPASRLLHALRVVQPSRTPNAAGPRMSL